MKNKFLEISLLVVMALLIIAQTAYAQSCNTLKEIFENDDYCDNKKISVGGVISEILDSENLMGPNGSKYIFGFWIIDENNDKIRIVSADDMILISGNIVMVDGRYYKKLYADGLNLNDTIVASSDNIQVVLTAMELWSDILKPYGESLSVGEKLAVWNKIFIATIPLFLAIAFYFGLIFHKRRKYKGISFEGYVENLFNKQDWRLSQSNAYRKHNRWIESNNNPDFIFIHRKTNKKIAIECKYKEKEYEKVFWAYEDQIERYQNFSDREKIPVFIVIGIGGRPKNPRRVFLISLSQIKSPDIRIDYLEKFERYPKKSFSLDNQGNVI